MAMSKKDYVAMAAVIAKNYAVANSVDGRDAIREVALNMAGVFAKDNPRFNMNMFLKACGVA